jgi:hypothetical protein
MKDCYFIVDDVLSTGSGREGFAVMYGNPQTAIGSLQKEAYTLRECMEFVSRATDSKTSFARVRLARRHGMHSVRWIRPDWRFKNADGSLTRYSFACGYIERKEQNGVAVELWHEGACFHVRAHDHNKGERLLWDSFETNDLKGARRAYRAAVRQHLNGVL